MKMNKQTVFSQPADEIEDLPEDKKSGTPSALPDFSLEEALRLNPNQITPDDFLQMAKVEMQRVFGDDLELEPESEIPPRIESEGHDEQRVRRNVILMKKYLEAQISCHADPEQRRTDLVTMDRFLNTYLRSLDLDAEDAYRELTDYFEGYLMNLDPLPPFTPQFGALSRFYTWLGEEPSLLEETNFVNMTVPRACKTLLLVFRNDIPYLTRLYNIASDPANDRLKSVWYKTDEGSHVSVSEKTKESSARVRVSNWRNSQCTQNRQIISRLLLDIQKNHDWKPLEVDYAIETARLYLLNTLPSLLLRADQCAYDLKTTIRRTRRVMKRSERTVDYELFTKSFLALIDTLTDLSLLPPESSARPLDPYYPNLLDQTDIESLAPYWPRDQAPNSFEETLSWLKWNIDRNERFLLAFKMDLENSGMDSNRVLEHVFNVQALMGELLRYEGRTMETLPEGLDDLLHPNQDYFEFVSDPNELSCYITSLRRFYLSMVKQGYLAPDTGVDLLSQIKRQTPVWLEHIG